MSHFWSSMVFASIALLVLFGMHRYVWARLVRDVGFQRGLRIGLTVAIAMLGVIVPITFVVGRRSMDGGVVALSWLTWVWFGLLFYLVLLLFGIDVVRGLARLTAWIGARGGGRERAAIDPERRRFLARAGASVAAVGAGVIATRGVRASGEITTPEIEVKLERLPRVLSGFRIVQITDVHMGPIVDDRFLDALVEKANALKPDLVAITGDMVDGSVAMLGRDLAPLAKLRARHGVVFVTGNHEYYAGADEWIEYLRAQKIRVLMNERMVLGDSTSGGASFDLAGIPDRHGGSYSIEHLPDLERALRGRDPERELVLLAHQPAQIEMAQGRGVGLQLSGHTHGGQMWPFGALVHLAQPYVEGLHRHPDGTQIYVSRGAGFWGPPLRVANPAEVACIVLT